MKMLIACWGKSRLRLFLSAGFVLLLLAALPESTYACSPPDPYRPVTLAQKTRAADLVLEVSLLEIEMVSGVHPFPEATFTVHSWLKGAGPSTVTIRGFGPSETCMAEVPEFRAILFASGDPLAGPLTLQYRGVDGPVVSSSPEALAEIAAAIHLQRMMVRGIAVGLPMILVIVVMIVWRRRRSIQKNFVGLD